MPASLWPAISQKISYSPGASADTSSEAASPPSKSGLTSSVSATRRLCNWLPSFDTASVPPASTLSASGPIANSVRETGIAPPSAATLLTPSESSSIAKATKPKTRPITAMIVTAIMPKSVRLGSGRSVVGGWVVGTDAMADQCSFMGRDGKGGKGGFGPCAHPASVHMDGGPVIGHQVVGPRSRAIAGVQGASVGVSE